MKLSLALLLSATMLAGCATTADQPVVDNVAASPVASAAPAAKPAYGTFGFDEAGMDKTVQPGDNFYNYASGTWTKNTPIPEDKSNYGAFNILSDLSESRTREILDGVATDPNSKIGVAYATYLDRAAIDTKGLAPRSAAARQDQGDLQGRLFGADRRALYDRRARPDQCRRRSGRQES